MVIGTPPLVAIMDHSQQTHLLEQHSRMRQRQQTRMQDIMVLNQVPHPHPLRREP